MHEIDLLTTFAAGLGAALVLGYLAQRVGLSPLVGYLVAGIAVGPFTPGFVANRAIAEQLAEIGIILLLFGIGLRLHLHELVAVWRVALPGALVQSAASTGVLALLLHLVGWSWTAGLVLGAGISVASTVVMAMVLGARRDLNAPIGHLAIGWTVVEDLLTVVLLLVLPMLAAPGSSEEGPWRALGVAALKMVGLSVTVAVLGKWAIPWALERVERTRSRELFTLAVLVLAVGLAVGAAVVFGVSIALGAFLAGLAVGRSEFAARAASDALPMRDAFAVLFFVSAGMLFNPRSLVDALLLVALVLVVVLVVKPAAAALTARLFGTPWSTAIPLGAAFAQVGEFSFILGVQAQRVGLLGDAGWDALVAASILSISLNPSVYGWARRWSRRVGAVQAGAAPPEVDPKACILVGYGPVGQQLRRLLAERGATITVVELNLETVRRLKADGVAAVYGDAVRAGVLDEAGLASAGTLILSAEMEGAAEVVRQARQANPHLRVLARCGRLREAGPLRRAGAIVIAGEAEVAAALARAAVAEEGAAPGAFMEQGEIIRRELYGSVPAEGEAKER
ncbi:MAG TPA: cation:proton antiporter [Myxococcaceae bacterium]|jgi:CPA2 family monovalent cation:H+ antiporter-2